MTIQPGPGYTFTSSGQGTNLNVMQPLEGFTSMVYETTLKHPFQVTDLGPTTVSGVTKYWFTVKPGLVNNLDPMIASSTYFMTHMPVSDYEFVYYEFQFNVTSHFAWIVLKLGFDAATGEFPDSNTAHVSASPSYPVVGCLTFAPTTNDTDAYLVLAKAYQDPVTKAITISQYVTGSLWSLRVQYGTNPALYYYNRI